MTQELPSTSAFPTPTREQWLALVEKDLKGAPFEKRLVTQLIEGLKIMPLYTSGDAPSADQVGLPGQAPFIRGSADLRLVGPRWLILPEHRHPLPAEANQAILSDMAHGAQGVAVRLSPRLLGEAGSPKTGCGCGGGVLVDSLDDLDQLLNGVELTQIQLTIHPGPAFLASAATVLALYTKRGIANGDVHCQFGADPLGTLAARGTLPESAESLLAQLGSLAKNVASWYPSARSAVVSTAAYDNAGATAVQELAAALSTAVTYLRAMEDAGLTTAEAARQLTFSLAVGADQFLEIAKFRALRALVNRLLEAADVPEGKRSMQLHARTSRRILTQRDPYVNVLRTTVGCFAAAIGGADQITVLAFDDVLGPSDEGARRLARNTQIILQEEGHLGRVVDAAGGSYYVENLTLALAEAAWQKFQDIERRGGMLSVLRDGSFAKELDSTHDKRSKDLARRKMPITGISEFPHLGEKPVERAKVDTSAQEASLLDRRKQRAADRALGAAITSAASQPTEKRLAALVGAAAHGATLFALHLAVNGGSSKAESLPALHLRRFAEPYERLRDQSDCLLAERGQRPRIFSANMGPIAVHTARAMFAQNFFEAGGFEVLTNDGFADVAGAAAAFTRSGAKTVIICSSDAWYDGSACDLARALKQSGALCVILAGNPGQNEAKYREAGIDRFIFIGCDVLGTLTELAQAELAECAHPHNKSCKNESTAS